MKTVVSKHTIFSLSVVGLALSACGATSLDEDPNAYTSTGTVTGSTVNEALSDEVNSSVSNPSVGTVAFVTGINIDDRNITGLVGIAAGADVGDEVEMATGGTATYSTDYAYQTVDEIEHYTTGDEDIIEGLRVLSEDSLTLTADFENATLTGSDENIIVDGTINGTTLGGNVVATSSISNTQIDSVINGQIGDTGLIGTFHGHDDDTLIVGGFVGTAD